MNTSKIYFYEKIFHYWCDFTIGGIGNFSHYDYECLWRIKFIGRRSVRNFDNDFWNATRAR